MTKKHTIHDLIAIMARLRNPEGGCPWDLEQNFKSIAPYTIEEAYEVADAITRDDMAELRDELGDLLFQVIYHTQMAQEKGLFTFEDVVDGIATKMIHRHPHVFGDEEAKTAGDVNVLWEERKDKEKKRQSLESILDDVPLNLPALKRAQKLQKRAGSVGFEWPELGGVLDKMEEEIKELRKAIKDGRQNEVIDELGDVFFVVTNFGRMLGADCEEALTQSSNKFIRRFQGMEKSLKDEGIAIQNTPPERWDDLWLEQKRKEKQA